ncbi:MAG: YceI family protein [Eudoraea sp.]|nr:YceI family protein [Eudoraea sp.]
MKQFLSLLFLFVLVSPALGQERLRTSEGVISFNASSPLEDIVAKNESVNGILDLQTGEMAVVLLIKEFQFRKKLMQEHFNENYLESERYPKAFFSGTISGFSEDQIENQNKEFQLSGEITIHGVAKSFENPVWLRKNGASVVCTLDFIVHTEEHKIKIPRVLFKKIAQEVNVQVELQLAEEK